MYRRQFISYSAASISGLYLSGLQSCSSQISNPTDIAPDLLEIDIPTVQGLFNDGSLTIEQLVRFYLDRIESIDKSGPAIQSIIQVNENAIDIAKTLDKELKNGKSRGPLHGIPILLKDNIDTKDMFTTAGSKALAGSLAPDDSWIANALRKAGAIILGKANLSEWANFRGEPSTSGWSGHGGLTKNPYKLDRNTCGSSAGSGASVSANLAMLAIGTETNGSIICPSQTCGIVGIKPTVGLVSRDGIIPISFSQDTAGPMARTVTDAAICLSAITGMDPIDTKTIEAKEHHGNDYTKFLNENSLSSKRIGVYHSRKGRHPRVDRVFDKAVQDMKDQGATIIELENVMDGPANSNSFNVMLHEYKDGLNKYFKSLGENAKIKKLEDLIAFNKEDDMELYYYDQTYLEQALEKDDLESEEYRTALEAMYEASRTNGIDKVMAEHKLDAIVSPSGSPAWKSDLTNGDNFSLGSSSAAAISGYPNITVPMGFIDGLPIGISIYGKAWSEGTLIEIGYSYEQATQHRQAPQFLPE